MAFPVLGQAELNYDGTVPQQVDMYLPSVVGPNGLDEPAGEP